MGCSLDLENQYDHGISTFTTGKWNTSVEMGKYTALVSVKAE